MPLLYKLLPFGFSNFASRIVHKCTGYSGGSFTNYLNKAYPNLVSKLLMKYLLDIDNCFKNNIYINI
jgi:hypothetical protein